MPECPTCSEELDTEAGVKIHHYYKHGESIALKESECENCGSRFEYYPSEKKGLFCEECSDNSWGNENLNHKSGEQNNKWKGGPEETCCDFCGDDIVVSRWNYKEYENNFCSKECVSAHLSELYSGEGNPRYIDGNYKQRKYGKGWKKAKRETLERDGYKCKNCGKTKEEIGRNPDVHHKKPVREFDNPENAHELDNLVCLCRSCHISAEFEQWSN